MSIRTLLLPSSATLVIPEDIQGFVLACHDRYYEAMELLIQDMPYAATYLAGYSAEIILKAMSFQFLGAKPGDLVKPFLVPAIKYADNHANFASIKPRNAHNLSLWAMYLCCKRIDASLALPSVLQAEFLTRATRMNSNWEVSMRYHSHGRLIGYFPLDFLSIAETMLFDIDWLRKHSLQLGGHQL
jgi:hypothetical protein